MLITSAVIAIAVKILTVDDVITIEIDGKQIKHKSLFEITTLTIIKL